MTPRRLLQENLITLLRKGDFDAVARLAGREKGVVDALLQFLYDPRDLLLWRALEGLGQVAARHPEQVRRVITRLLWLLNEDSGSFGWGAAAALGEIGRRQLSLVRDIIPMFCGFLEEKFSRGSMLWGIGRLAEIHPEELTEVAPYILASLTDEDPQVRGLGAWCAGKMRAKEAKAALQGLLGDQEVVTLYEKGELHQTTVGRLAREALDLLD
jgi:hypothetical protein